MEVEKFGRISLFVKQALKTALKTEKKQRARREVLWEIVESSSTYTQFHQRPVKPK
ncbi:hypothetical protein KDAU_62410 [Dictyobacter aurantiacus]|uniref:Uncharacterized protein n=1 Tax=Dictyobacter aurantiacus TaxID=1936993 RepID=A0A401ZQ10_9CHLR|nr:hypothetical protein KDAU_62410 [Dictyobacter aurantiacus]